MTQARYSELVEKWNKELTALSDVSEDFNDDPFTWNVKCIEILEAVEKRITTASTGQPDKPSAS